MLEAVGRIRTYVADIDFEGYAASPLVRDGVERNLERLSEASRHLPDDWKARRPEIPWREIAGIGNILRHAYDRIDDRVVWNVVSLHLDALEAALRALAGGTPD
jgi:uncharacterized protein with HEPN domain